MTAGKALLSEDDAPHLDVHSSRSCGAGDLRSGHRGCELHEPPRRFQQRERPRCSGRDVDLALDSSAFQHIRATVQALVDEGIRLQDDPSTIALELWTAAHGVAAMLIAKPHLPFGEAEAFADRVFRSAFVGRVVVGLVGQDVAPQDFVAWARAHTSVEER